MLRGEKLSFSYVKKLLSLSLIQQYVFITIRLIIHARNQKEAFDRKNQHISSRIKRAVTFMSNFFLTKANANIFFVKTWWQQMLIAKRSTSVLE